MITSINEYRQILESINDDLMKLAQQFQKDHPLPADWEGPGDCIEETAAFIMWAETKGMSGRFVKLWGAPLQAKFGAAWMHSVVLDTTSNMVIDLTHDQFDEKIPIRIYSAEEFKEKWPVGIDEEGNYINEFKNSNYKNYTFKLTEESIDGHPYFHVSAIYNGYEIGELNFIVQNNYLTDTIVEVDNKYQRQGIASAMYQYAEEQMNMKFDKSGEYTEDGQSLWSNPHRKFGITNDNNN